MENKKSKVQVGEAQEIDKSLEENDLVKKLFDPENDENIILYDDEDNEIEFEQLAVIPQEGSVYVVLRPLDQPEVDEDEQEVIIFCVSVNDEGETFLELEEDDEIAENIFQKFLSLIEQTHEEGEATTEGQ